MGDSGIAVALCYGKGSGGWRRQPKIDDPSAEVDLERNDCRTRCEHLRNSGYEAPGLVDFDLLAMAIHLPGFRLWMRLSAFEYTLSTHAHEGGLGDFCSGRCCLWGSLVFDIGIRRSRPSSGTRPDKPLMGACTGREPDRFVRFSVRRSRPRFLPGSTRFPRTDGWLRRVNCAACRLVAWI
jgi:hypothetical protein